MRLSNLTSQAGLSGIAVVAMILFLLAFAAIAGDVEKARARQEAIAAHDPILEDTDESLMQAAHDPRILALGQEVFVGTCSACHRDDGGGNVGPNLTDRYWIHGGRPTQVLRTIRTGVVDQGMPRWGEALPAEKVRATAAYVLTLRGTYPPNPKAPQGTASDGDSDQTIPFHEYNGGGAGAANKGFIHPTGR